MRVYYCLSLCFWEFWKFQRSALLPPKLKTRGVIFWVSLLFFMGVAFGYFVLTPFMVNFYFTHKLSDLDRN
ncbi:MAG: twin-arginine translocase subunit TatC [Chitinophagaceae bacterium]|nr:twin-arginine translocase subunit TatC [Chitinophagaceae bacterium]